jgi:hypothetical protein
MINWMMAAGWVDTDRDGRATSAGVVATTGRDTVGLSVVPIGDHVAAFVFRHGKVRVRVLPMTLLSAS